MNSILQSLGKGRPNPMELMGQFRQNPIGILQQVGYQIPDGMTNPQQIVNHLMQSGQLPNERLQKAQQMLSMFR